METQFSPMAIQILEKRYLLKDPSGKIIETPDELLIRVARYVCGENKELYNLILKIMRNKEFLPNTPTLMNADTTNMLSACFVIPIEDSLESIVHDALWYQAKIHQRGGGTGINFSNLRPEGDSIKSTGGISSGVMHFIRNFDTMSGSIKQGGKREGANMTILSIYHPEIENFIKAKTEDNINYENMNFSVLIDDHFMKSLRIDGFVALTFPIKSKDQKDVRKVVKAKYLWDLICNSAHKCGCPGMLFEDTINDNNLLKDHGFYISITNPCGEQPLFCGKYNGEMIAESCNLGSINLSKFVNQDKNGIDFNRLKDVIHITTEFLDRIIDKNVYPFEFIEKGTKLTRKIGLGITSFSDYLIKIGVPYSSPQAISEAKNIMKFVTEQSHLTSLDLGLKYGKYPLAELIGDKRRNNMCTTIAPTGTIARLMNGHGYSSGIEPPFAISMKSSIIGTSIDDGIHPLLLEKLNELYFDSPEIKTRIIEQIKQNGSSIQNISQFSDKFKQLFLTANEISIDQHVAIQSAFQEFTDSAVSKTINMNNKASVEDVSNAFKLAWGSKCKGMTIYRDGSKIKQVLNVIKKENKINDLSHPIEDLAPRPPMLGALSFTKKTACNTLFINPTYLGNLDKTALECFIDANGGCTAMRTGLAVCISVYQRILETVNPELSKKGLDIVMSHLQGVTCQACTKQMEKEKHLTNVKHPVDSISCPAAVANVMKFMLEHKIETLIDGKPLIHDIKYINLLPEPEIKKCDECGLPLIRQGGCSSLQCPKCGKGGCN